MKNIQNKYLIIDICGTLYKSNTTLDFIRFLGGDNARIKFLFSLPFRAFSRIIAICFHIDLLRTALIKKLKGIKKSDLMKMSATFYDNYLQQRINKEVFDLIENKRQQGYKLILVSATLDIIAEEVAKRTNIPTFLSSELAYDSDYVCQGFLKQDLLPDKSCALNQQNILPPYCAIVTDNYSDALLIEHSEHPYLVCYGSTQGKWSKHINNKALEKCHFIKV